MGGRVTVVYDSLQEGGPAVVGEIGTSGREDELLAIIAVKDRLKATASGVVKELRGQGLDILTDEHRLAVPDLRDGEVCFPQVTPSFFLFVPCRLSDIPQQIMFRQEHCFLPQALPGY